MSKNLISNMFSVIILGAMLAGIIYGVFYLVTKTDTTVKPPKNVSDAVEEEQDANLGAGDTSPDTTAGAEPKPATNQLQYAILKEGAGAAAKQGDKVTVHYVGALTDGTKFDSSLDRGTPFTFTIGAGQVIAGWEIGVAGMKVGERRRLIIPPEYGYGERGTPGGPIPPNATLVFEIELLKIN